MKMGEKSDEGIGKTRKGGVGNEFDQNTSYACLKFSIKMFKNKR